MNIVKWLCLLIPALLLGACSKQQIYEMIKQNRQQQCEQLAGASYEECMGQYDQSYEEYEANRQGSRGTQNE